MNEPVRIPVTGLLELHVIGMRLLLLATLLAVLGTSCNTDSREGQIQGRRLPDNVRDLLARVMLVTRLEVTRAVPPPASRKLHFPTISGSTAGDTNLNIIPGHLLI
ncbi:MAG TPA: hypothetical protein PLN56_01330 [Methanoregulaceae archaeon]|nr:hypothetical protein [Methanoregulaceae archaeon]